MGAARVILGPAAWRRARRAAAMAAALLAAAPGAAPAQEDTVRVEWARSLDDTRVILNAYPLRGGRPVADSIRGLRIDRDPLSGPDRLYPSEDPDNAYASAESQGIRELLEPFVTVLDKMANNGGASGNPAQFSTVEWTRLLDGLLQPGERKIVEGTHRLIVAPVAEPVRSLIAADLEALFQGDDPRPLLPHLASGRLAMPGARGGGPDSIHFGSVKLGERDSASVSVWNYGVRSVETRLRFSGVHGDTTFSSGPIRTLEVRPGETVQVALSFAPDTAAPQEVSLDFLVDGERVAQVLLTGEGKSAGLLKRAGRWLVTRWWAVVLLALAASAVVAREKGWPLRWPWWRRAPRVVEETVVEKEPVEEDPVKERAREGDEQKVVSPATDPAVHRQITIAFESLQDALALLGTVPGSDGGGAPHGDGRNPAQGNTTRVAEKLRSLEDLERERDGFVEERSQLREHARKLEGERDQLDRQVRTLEAERTRWDGQLRTLQDERTRQEAQVHKLQEDRTRLGGQVRTLEADRARLERQVESLKGVRAENEQLRAQVAEAERTLSSLHKDVRRINEERETLSTRLTSVAAVLELSDEMLSDHGWPETQRRLPMLHDGGKPRYLWNFEQLVADLTAIFEEIAPHAGEGRLAAAVSAVLAGSNQNAGLRAVAIELERETLAKCLGLAHPRELRTLQAERFYRGFVDRRFRPVIDNIAKLGLYARSRSPEIGMGQRLAREGVDPALLERALVLVETRMRVDFGVEVQSVRLFEERFDRSRHDTAAHSTLRHTLPDLDASIRRLAPETIYDITSVGFRSDRLGVSVRPVVAWVTPH